MVGTQSPNALSRITRSIIPFGDATATPIGHTFLDGGAKPGKRQRREGQTDVSIRVKERLDPTWTDWLEGLQIAHEADGASRLFGPIQDQPALFGVLTKLGRLHLTLLSFESGERAENE